MAGLDAGSALPDSAARGAVCGVAEAWHTWHTGKPGAPTSPGAKKISGKDLLSCAKMIQLSCCLTSRGSAQRREKL